MSDHRRPARRTLVAGALGIAAVWALAPAPSPPLYDGLSGPAEAYRYLNPPPGYQHTAPPGSASSVLDVAGGTVGAGFLVTEEQPPQAQFLTGNGALVAPAGARNITLAIKPVPPPTPLPESDGRIAGNVYAITAVADAGGEVTIKPGLNATVVLRGPPGTSQARIARLDAAGTWTTLPPISLGNGVPDMVAANTTRLGDFAMVLPATPAPVQPGGSGGGGFPVVAVVVPLVVLALLGTMLLIVRTSRTRRL